MNLENLKTLITTVEAAVKADTFDISRYKHGGCSPACIIGHAAALANDGFVPRTRIVMMKIAAQYLGITYENAVEIGVGWVGDIEESNPVPSNKQAIAYLKVTEKIGHFISWSDFLGEPRS
jgi:hypothetical protein